MPIIATIAILLSLFSAIIAILFSSTTPKSARLIASIICIACIIITETISGVLLSMAKNLPLIFILPPLFIISEIVMPWIVFAKFREKYVKTDTTVNNETAN